MKATLTFDLSDKEEKFDHFRCVKALDMALALNEIYHLKKQLTWELDNRDIDKHQTLYIVMEKIYTILEENDLNISELLF